MFRDFWIITLCYI